MKYGTPTNLKLALKVANEVKQARNSGITDGRSLQFKENAFVTWRAILKAAQHKLRYGAATPDDAGYYTFRFCNHDIAAYGHICQRTAMRHRIVLRQAGLIHAERFRGRQHPYEIVIHAKYLGIVQHIDDDANAEELEALCFEQLPSHPSISPSGDKLSALSEDDKIKQENGPVEKGMLPGCAPAADGHDDKIDGQGIADGNERKHGGTDREGLARRGEGAPGRGGAGGADPSSLGDYARKARENAVRGYAQRLWDYARPKLWPGWALSDHQVRGAMAHILRGYCTAYDHGHDVARWHEIFCEMIDMTKAYIDRDPSDSFVATLRKAHEMRASGGGGTMPTQRFIVTPNMYFDPNFKGGFKGVYKWWLQAEADRQRSEADTALVKAARIWRGNERKSASKARDRVELWKELTDKLAALKQPAIMDRWFAYFGGHGDGKEA